MVTFGTLMQQDSEKVVFLDKNDFEYTITEVEQLFEVLQDNDLVDDQLKDAIKHLTIDEFLKEFRLEFVDMITDLSNHCPADLERLSVLTEHED